MGSSGEAGSGEGCKQDRVSQSGGIETLPMIEHRMEVAGEVAEAEDDDEARTKG